MRGERARVPGSTPRRTAGGPASRIHWDRLGRVLLVLVMFAVLAWYVQPAINFFNAWRGANAERVQLHQLSVEHTQLVKKAACVSDAQHQTGREPPVQRYLQRIVVRVAHEQIFGNVVEAEVLPHELGQQGVGTSQVFSVGSWFWGRNAAPNGTGLKFIVSSR